MGASWSNRIKATSLSNTGCTSKFGITSVDIPYIRRGDDISSSCRNSNLKNFKYNNLKVATRNFHPDSVLGESTSGSVFKGQIDEQSFAATKRGIGMSIAVKRLNPDWFEGYEEWLNYMLSFEINYLGQLQHPNLVKLIGYCFEDKHRLLVYEFMPKGSLENHLFKRPSIFQPFSWCIRLKVALGAARGLAFLHEHKIIHPDFKSSNILLDTNYNAKLSDFGLASDEPTGDINHGRVVIRSPGYRAPEYALTGQLTVKSDVYSFGVVLLEMISGRRVLDKNEPSEKYNLVKWAKPYLSNKRGVFRLMDPRLQGKYSKNKAQAAAILALICLSETPECRPNMDEVVKALELLQESKVVQRPSAFLIHT